MSIVTKGPKTLFLLSALTIAVPGVLSAQETSAPVTQLRTTMSGAPAAKGPDLKGVISGRSGDKMQVTAEDGTKTIVAINDSTKITASKGFLGLGRNKLSLTSLLNGLPVAVKTSQGGETLIADQVNFRNTDFKTARMIHTGTAQGFDEQTAATGTLRGRMADIGDYNVKGTTSVNFDTGKAQLSPQARADLCAATSTAEGMKNALILVVGYTDSTGPQEYNQQLSEKRASRVVNYIQQACHWKPYRMLTPTGMAEADPLASNDSPEGKAQNRRVAVNILVSKGLDGL
ncbi:OmpA family protein [Glacieibacterium sp.]|uniref:OmpA family protein n=1 Tax=Glacieibacterium sp. TaxID=2860237 RepID=UPI003B00800C